MKNIKFELSVRVCDSGPGIREKKIVEFLLAIARGSADKQRKLRSLDKESVSV